MNVGEATKLRWTKYGSTSSIGLPFSKALSDNTQNVKSIWFFVIFKWGRCTNEWLIFVAFSSFCNTHLVLLSPSKTYSAKFFNWDLVLDYQLDYENICTIIS